MAKKTKQKDKQEEKKKIDFKYNLQEYWGVLKRQKGKFFLLLFITLIVEALFLVDNLLFKRIIDDGTEFVAGNLDKPVFMQTLIIIAGVFLGISVIKVIGKWLNVLVLASLNSNLVLELKRKYFDHILGLSHSFHSTHKTGSLISRLIRGSGAMENLTDIAAFNFAPLVFQLIIVGTALLYFNKTSALVILIVSITFVSYSYMIQHFQQKHRLKLNEVEDKEKGFVSDIFMNVDSIKYFGKENAIKRRFGVFARRTRFFSLQYWKYFRWFDSGQLLILALGTFFLVYFPLMEFLDGGMTIGTLVFIYTAYGNVVGPMFGFVWGMRGFYRSMADLQDLFGYSKIKNDVKDRKGAKILKIERGKIEFSNIGFNYGRRKIFKNFNLTIKPHERIAIVGHSGCGKTTLIKLLYRLYDVKSGAILIDGKDIEEFKQESLRNELGIVPQETVLFDDTLYRNIAFSNPKASRKEIRRAMKFAQLHKIIKNFPQGENTIVGERGVRLSGGEKQRVSIARAILANKKVLILDEATSSLDSETEHEIQKSLAKLLKGRTSIIIAHRLSTIMGADRIIVMKKGKIIQQGKHRSLIRKPGEYRKLWNLQKGGYIK